MLSGASAPVFPTFVFPCLVPLLLISGSPRHVFSPPLSLLPPFSAAGGAPLIFFLAETGESGGRIRRRIGRFNVQHFPADDEKQGFHVLYSVDCFFNALMHSYFKTIVGEFILFCCLLPYLTSFEAGEEGEGEEWGEECGKRKEGGRKNFFPCYPYMPRRSRELSSCKACPGLTQIIK